MINDVRTHTHPGPVNLRRGREEKTAVVRWPSAEVRADMTSNDLSCDESRRLASGVQPNLRVLPARLQARDRLHLTRV